MKTKNLATRGFRLPHRKVARFLPPDPALLLVVSVSAARRTGCEKPCLHLLLQPGERVSTKDQEDKTFRVQLTPSAEVMVLEILYFLPPH